MNNLTEATQWLSQNKTIHLHNNFFIEDNLKEKIYGYLSNSYNQKKIQKITRYILSKITTTSKNEAPAYLQLGDALINRYRSSKNLDKIVRTFDRTIAKFREKATFTHPLNQAAYEKWMRYSMPSSIYQNHPEFCEFLESSGLLSQIKVTKYLPKEINKEAAILVNGTYMRWPELKASFEVIYSKRYQERFLIHKDTREVYTFLDNGKGLQPHHPFMTELNAISQLTPNEYQTVLKKAHCFIRPGEEQLSEEKRKLLNKNRIFILQAVTSFIDGPNTRAHRFLCRAKHPYLRLIVGQDNLKANTRKGQVYEVGFGWKRRVPIPFITTQGQFRTPDLWEYVNCEEKIVTNIPITQEEALALYYYTIKYHRDGVNIGNETAFHLGEQNCSTYTRMALTSAGIPVPTEMSLAEILQEIAPEWIRKIGSSLAAIHRQAESKLVYIAKVLPKEIKNPLSACLDKISQLITSLIKSMAALSLLPIRTALGGGLGKGGNAFVPIGSPERRIEPSLFNWHDWFKLSSYHFNLPAVFQQWQRQQASTVVYHCPVRFTIVPE